VRPTPVYEQVQSLVEELDAALRAPVIDLTKVRELSKMLGSLMEYHAAMLKVIHDLAEQGQISVRTRRWLGQLPTDQEAA
jgi:hypothetical protein